MSFIKKIEITEELKEKMLKMYEKDKMSLQKIAKVTGLGLHKVHRTLKKMNYIPRSNREQTIKYSFNENYFHEIDDEHKAYWLGYICADGTIYEKTSTDSGTLKIETKDSDEELIHQFQKDIKDNHPIKHYGNKHFKDYMCSRISLKSNQLIDDLKSYGIGARKSLTLDFPQQMISNEFVNAFIRGYFDGDGSLCLYKNGIFDIKIYRYSTIFAKYQRNS